MPKKSDNDVRVKSEIIPLTKSELKHLLKLRKAVFQMCHDRGYKVSDFELNEDLEEFSEYFQDRSLPDNELNILLSHVWNGADKIYVIFSGETSLKAGDVQEYVNVLSEMSVSKAIIVIPTRESISRANEALKACAPSFVFEVFTAGELLLNPMKHVLSPKYTPLNREETQQILINEKVSISQLPRIRLSDPVARYFGLRRGEVIRLEEKNEKGAFNTLHKVVF